MLMCTRMRSAAAALASRSAGERVAGEACTVDSQLRRAKERRLRRPEVLPRIAMLALEKQQIVGRANVGRATGAGVDHLDGRQEDRPPATPLRPDQPVSLLVVEEEALVEQADVTEGGTAHEEACAPRRIHRPSFGWSQSSTRYRRGRRQFGKRAARARSSEIMSKGRGAQMQFGCSVPSVFRSRGTTAPTRGSRNASSTST